MGLDTSRVWGPDISPWDGDVNLSVTKSLGASFVFIKAIDGTVVKPYFVDNRQRAINAGLLHAPYGWLYRDANVSCVGQARAYSSLVSRYPSDLPPAIDFEWTKWMGTQSNPTYDDLDKWVTEWLRLGNRKPILSSAGYMNPLGRIPTALKEKFSGFWFANYGTNAPLLPYGFTRFDFWQFTATADPTVYAPNSNNKLELDLNYWNGDLVSLYIFAGTRPVIQPPPTGDTMATYEGIAKLTSTPNVRIRQPFPDGSLNEIGTTIGGIMPGMSFKGDKTSPDSAGRGVWMHVTEYGGKPIDGWSAGWLLDYVEVTPPPPASTEYIMYYKDGIGRKFIPE